MHKHILLAIYKNKQHKQIETIIYGDNMPKTDAQRRAENKYHREKMDAIAIRYPKGTKAKIQQLSILAGKSMARYIMDAIAAQAQRDGHADILAAVSDRDGDRETETDGSAEEDRE